MSSVDEPRTRTPRWAAIGGGALVPLALVIAWWAVSAAGIVSPRLLPSPQDAAAAAAELASTGALAGDLGASAVRVLLGFAGGSVAGLLLGAGLRRSRAARILFSPTIAAVRAVPTVAWLPVLLLYLGVGEAPKIAVIAIGAAFPVLAALTAEPDARVAVMSGLRTGLTQSWVFLVTAELLHATAGLGFLLMDASKEGRADRLVVGIVLLVVLARVGDALMARLERRLRDRARPA